VDYTDKYGFGYQLSDESVAVAFNDGTKLIMLANEADLQYIERDGNENYHKATSYPASLSKKMKLLDYFRRYMVEHLVRAGGRRISKEADSMARMPYLCHWFRSRNCVIMFLTNGTLQVGVC
jgi:polo-like kinase 1